MKRVIEFDFWRGLAVLGMVAFHVAFTLNMYGSVDINFYSGFWYWLGWIVRVLFILLVGISMTYCYLNYKEKYSNEAKKRFYLKQLKRSVQIMILAVFFVTLPSLFVLPEMYVRFGVLHFIAAGLALMMWFVDKPYVLAAIAYFVYPISKIMKMYDFGEFGMILGFTVPPGTATLDLFRIIPWVGVIAMGMLLGHIFYTWYKPRMQKTGIISYIGKHALSIYVLHLIVIFGGIGIIKLF